MQCQPPFLSFFFSSFCKKSLILIEICTLTKIRRLMPTPWKATADPAEIEIEDFQDLMNLRLCFQPGLLALMLDYTPSVPPLPPLKYGSDGRKGQQPVWGRQLRGRWMGGGGGGERLSAGGRLCVTPSHPWRSQTQRQGVERASGRWWRGFKAVNGEYFKAVALYSCLDWQQIMHGTWFGVLRPLEGAWGASGSCTDKI